MLRSRFSEHRLVRVVALLIAGAMAAPACGGSEPAPRKIVQVQANVLPPTVMGLTVARENIDKLMKSARRPYIDELGLFSFRRDDLLQATLQVNRFSEDAAWETADFRRTVATQIIGSGGEVPEFRMGDATIYLGGNARQTQAVWFEGPYMMVMAARTEFEEPRGLLRRLVELGIGKAA